MEYDIFLRTFLKILDKYAPMKKKYFKENHTAFMTEEERKAVMVRSKLKNKFLRTKMNNQRMIIENNAIYVSRLFPGQNSNTFLV